MQFIIIIALFICCVLLRSIIKRKWSIVVLLELECVKVDSVLHNCGVCFVENAIQWPGISAKVIQFERSIVRFWFYFPFSWSRIIVDILSFEISTKNICLQFVHLFIDAQFPPVSKLNSAATQIQKEKKKMIFSICIKRNSWREKEI